MVLVPCVDSVPTFAVRHLASVRGENSSSSGLIDLSALDGTATQWPAGLSMTLGAPVPAFWRQHAAYAFLYTALGRMTIFTDVPSCWSPIDAPPLASMSATSLPGLPFSVSVPSMCRDF